MQNAQIYYGSIHYDHVIFVNPTPITDPDAEKVGLLLANMLNLPR